MTKRVALWSTFTIASLMTIVASKTAWALSYHFVLLSNMGIVALISGALIIAQDRTKIWTWLLVLIGLAIGQWWFLLMAIVMIGWKIRGFAP